MIYIFASLTLALFAFILVETHGEEVLSRSHDLRHIKIDTVNRYYSSTSEFPRAAANIVADTTAESLKSLVPMTSSFIVPTIMDTYTYALSTSLYGLEVAEIMWNLIGRCFRLEIGFGRIGWYNHVEEGESIASIDANSPWFGLVQIMEPRFGSIYSNISNMDTAENASPLGILVRGLSSLSVTLPIGKALLGYFLLTDTQYGGQLILKLYSAALAFVRVSYFMAHDLSKASGDPTVTPLGNTSAPSPCF